MALIDRAMQEKRSDQEHQVELARLQAEYSAQSERIKLEHALAVERLKSEATGVTWGLWGGKASTQVVMLWSVFAIILIATVVGSVGYYLHYMGAPVSEKLRDGLEIFGATVKTAANVTLIAAEEVEQVAQLTADASSGARHWVSGRGLALVASAMSSAFRKLTGRS